MMYHHQPSNGIQKQRKHPRILIVHSDASYIMEIARVLAESYTTFVAESGQQAIDFCLNTPPDLVLMDTVMPGMDGLTTCQKMKQHSDLKKIPVIFLTAFHEPEQEIACWEVGAIDLLFKPVTPATLRNRVKAHFSSISQTELLSGLVYQDSLTGIYNRRYLDEYYAQQIGRAKRNNQPLGLLMIDIDYFKQYNDIYGHVTGDRSLKRICKCLQSVLLRPADILARYGGEEFVCILPDTNVKGVHYIANEMLDAVAQLAIPHNGSPNHLLSISIGVAELNDSDNDDLIHLADTRLYKAKESGRNCCV
jgi:diguanylate cyclase (GGDEF)-like protein